MSREGSYEVIADQGPGWLGVLAGLSPLPRFGTSAFLRQRQLNSNSFSYWIWIGNKLEELLVNSTLYIVQLLLFIYGDPAKTMCRRFSGTIKT